MAEIPNANAVETTALCKTYRGSRHRPPHPALVDVTLAIPRGSFFGLLGPNGAGKSTLINILAGLVIKTSGTVAISGHDIDTESRASRRAIGVVPQELNIDPFFTPRELLEVQAGLYGVPPSKRRSDEILDLVGLGDKADAYTRTLSGGMRRRLLVAKAMVHSPDVLVLDEPTAGVDIDLRRRLWVAVRELNIRGTTVLLTTHYLEEAQALCDRIAIIDAGRVIACDTTEGLLHRIDAKEMTVTVDVDLVAVPAALHRFDPELMNGRRLVFRYPPSRTDSGQILAAVGEAGLRVVDLTTREAELEDIFLSLTRRQGATAP
ncbi:ABC transporter ATP-binding protein [Shumkonia mesophila]|uniref:ABC transporter ATP-binding protein n=1 Tax=Shumkonia mesophila TaxID=2838854 RepID=UPI00293512CE|nr:ABC transporter ATP-binding protein [Shumkonia mesophila]